MSAVLVRYSSGNTKRFTSQRAASRELSGDGTDRRRSAIATKANTSHGGYVASGRVWVKVTR